jgi:hypothetical protein
MPAYRRVRMPWKRPAGPWGRPEMPAAIANVMIEPGNESSLLHRHGVIASVEDAQKVLDRELPGNFAKARAALKPLVGGNLSRVVYVSYGNPALAGPNTPCAGGRDGFDVHPAFAADGERLRQAVTFVSHKFLPAIRALARCEEGCPNPSAERMSFVDAHQAAFVSHGACARAADDPAFDRECFSGNHETFESSLTKAATEPMTCGHPASEFRPYASPLMAPKTYRGSFSFLERLGSQCLARFFWRWTAWPNRPSCCDGRGQDLRHLGRPSPGDSVSAANEIFVP